MIRYEAFIKITETGSFTRAAESMGYTQSAISQMIKALEEELDTTLIIRSKKGIELSHDGIEFLPYIKNVHNAHKELIERRNEMRGLGSGVIRIGTLASISCNWLPWLMKEFKSKYPMAHFDLKQGEYTSVNSWIKDGSVDFGFINPDAAEGLTTVPLKRDEMLAVLPVNHKMSSLENVTLDQLADEPYILLDEGALCEPLEFFKINGLEPNIQYVVYDDYTIMSMVEEGLGISVLSSLVLNRHHHNIVLKSISPRLERTVSLAYKNKNILPIASRYFIDFLLSKRRDLDKEDNNGL
ncbi:HTH-type transcriptional regulator GltC [Clostridiales bacterium]|nr:HTH-type transcriptional regulator GltC [Clostridiales bacterium]